MLPGKWCSSRFAILRFVGTPWTTGDGSRDGAGAGFGSGAWRRRTAAATAAGGGAGVDVALRQQRCDGVRLQQNMIKAGRPRNPLGQPW